MRLFWQTFESPEERTAFLRGLDFCTDPNLKTVLELDHEASFSLILVNYELEEFYEEENLRVLKDLNFHLALTDRDLQRLFHLGDKHWPTTTTPLLRMAIERDEGKADILAQEMLQYSEWLKAKSEDWTDALETALTDFLCRRKIFLSTPVVKAIGALAAAAQTEKLKEFQYESFAVDQDRSRKEHL